MKVPQDDEGRAQRFLTVQSLYQDKEEAEAGKKAEMHELKSAIEDIDEAIQKLVDGGEQLGLFGEDEDEEAYQEEAARRKAEVLADAQFKVNEAVEVYYEDEWYPAKVSDVSAKEMADDGVEIEYQVSFSRSVSENLNLEELRQVSEEEIREIPKPAGRGKSKKNAKKKTSKRKTKKTTKA